MADQRTKLQTYTQLAADNSAVITSSYENWTAFLATAARFYKYSFLEQLMIHIQRPQATACAEYNVWRDAMRRYVRRSAKGIAVIRFIDQKPTLRYVFDVADTGPKEGARYPFLWAYKDEYQAVIPAALEARFQVPHDHRGLPIQLAAIAAQLAEKFWTNGQNQIISQVGEQLTDNLAETFQDAAAASVTYALLSRCGLHPEQIFETEDFANVYKFNTFRPVLALGMAVSKCGEAVLRCIEAAVKQYEREKACHGGENGSRERAPTPVSNLDAHPAPAPEPDQQQIEDSPKVPDVQASGASFIPPCEEEPPVQQEIPAQPLALTQTQPPAGNFHITDDRLGEGGPKAKFAMNMEAIAALKTIEAEGRTATQEEQETLSRYVGWGGIPEVFDAEKPEWAAEYQELKAILTEVEYASARDSVLNAHFTPPAIIRAVYETIQAMGFVSGNILEPSCGVGSFFGCLPEAMSASRLYGVELDGLTARIARQLYPKAQITAAGFETTDRRDFYDLAVGNVPFGQYQVHDLAYNKLGFHIHNYFFAKALDQLRPGGILAFVTSRFTMDAKDPAVRKYLAQRAVLLGAIRLPNNAFKANAGTDVVSDIIFFQKSDKPTLDEPEWVQTGQTKDGFPVNKYFLSHPEMVLGTLEAVSGPFGPQLDCRPIPGADLARQLREAAQHIHGSYQPAEPAVEKDNDEDAAIPADPGVKNYSFAVVGGEVYYRENSVMLRQKLNKTSKERVKGLVKLRTCVRELIDLQMDEYTPDSALQPKQAELNRLYDSYTRKYGLINDRANRLAFDRDSSYYLLCSLEILDDDGRLKRKADMFSKRTIKQHRSVTHVDTASEALAISIGERGRVDLGYMSRLTGKTEDEIITELRGVIYRDPVLGDWQTADEYLSGNVRKKLRQAQEAAGQNPAFQINVDALAAVIPRDLDATEIEIRLGATWIDPEYVQQFMYETFSTPQNLRKEIQVYFSRRSAEWFISKKNKISFKDVSAYSTYGTGQASAYRILEDSLNLRDVRIYKTVVDKDKTERWVLDSKATTLAAQKQQAIREAFKDWILRDPERRRTLVNVYNEKMNNIRPREYDGSHIVFSGINPEITLQPHQLNAIAHVLYGGNTLLAHEVGAGKTFEMIAAAMEAKRLGLCSKSIFVVPNHLTQQTASEFFRLYPAANILVTTRRDFETAKRKKFCARIATGDYDAVIIGHSQFEKIPVSLERQRRHIQEQISEITEGIDEVKRSNGEHFVIKDLVRTKKQLENQLKKLMANYKKDDVVTFEELGVDMMFVDESDMYKNLFLYTKMRNVAGLSTANAQKSSDMFAKCRYLDEITGGRGIVFATGTPISNSMTEMYSIQRYLQYDLLIEKGLEHFDCWASFFGETVTALELAPEGTGYRARTRFARFFNLPELMMMFKETADIKTAGQLNLPTPEVEYHNVVSKPTEHQKVMVQELSKRAEKVHSGFVDAHIDNMLRITSDGRKLGLDQRIINPLLPDEPGTKVNRCVENVLRLWREGTPQKLTQLIFCDISTPQKGKKAFNLYDDIRDKLVARGVPREEVAFIHETETDAQKKELFAKVNSGQVRVLIGSTQKMGAGTNIQQRLIASHDLECPWRPRDLIQRKGRIERRGNMNQKVHVFRYVTEATFDAYLWQAVENKQKFISQIMTSRSPARSCEDVDEATLSFAEIKALCAGNPRIKERMELDMDVSRLRLLKASHQSQQYRMEDNVLRYFPQQIKETQAHMVWLRDDMETLAQHPHPEDGFTGMTVLGRQYAEKATAGAALLDACKDITGLDSVTVGSYRGFSLSLSFSGFKHVLTLKGRLSYELELGEDPRGNLTRIDNGLKKLSEHLADDETRLAGLRHQLESAKAELGKPFL